eukprot:110794-Chlamydomonas_euryale.AAC.3
MRKGVPATGRKKGRWGTRRWRARPPLARATAAGPLNRRWRNRRFHARAHAQRILERRQQRQAQAASSGTSRSRHQSVTAPIGHGTNLSRHQSVTAPIGHGTNLSRQHQVSAQHSVTCRRSAGAPLPLLGAARAAGSILDVSTRRDRSVLLPHKEYCRRGRKKERGARRSCCVAEIPQ